MRRCAAATRMPWHGAPRCWRSALTWTLLISTAAAPSISSATSEILATWPLCCWAPHAPHLVKVPDERSSSVRMCQGLQGDDMCSELFATHFDLLPMSRCWTRAKGLIRATTRMTVATMVILLLGLRFLPIWQTSLLESTWESSHRRPQNTIDKPCRCAGSSLMLKPVRMENIVRSMSSILSCPLTIKVSFGCSDECGCANQIHDHCVLGVFSEGAHLRHCEPPLIS